MACGVVLTAPALAQDAPALFDLVGPLTVDDRYLGDIDLRVATDESGAGVVDVVRLAELLKPLVSVATGQLLDELARGERFRSFADASVGGITVTYDPDRLGLAAVVPTSGRQRNALRLGGVGVPRLADYATPSDVAGGVGMTGRKTFNYDGAGFGENLVGRAEGFVTIGGFEGFTLSSAVDYRSGASAAFVADGVTLTHDDFDRAIRYEAGSVLPQPVGLQSVGIINGIGIARRYQQIRPFQNIRPTGRQSILVERASTADIYVNGTLLTRTTLTPGPYDFDDFPLADGANDVRLVIQDSTGATQTIDRSVFFSPTILAPGLTDFGLWAGVPENAFPSGGRPLVASGYLLQGVDRATIGANAQASSRGMQIGGNVVQAFAPGFVAIDVAWSNRFDRGASDIAVALDAQFAFSLQAPRDLSFNARLEGYGRGFYGPVDGSDVNQVRYRAAGTANYRIDAVSSVSVGGLYLRTRPTDQLAWSVNVGLLRQFGRLNASAYLQHERLAGGRRGTSLRFGISLPLARSATATARTDTRSGRTELDISRFRRSIGPDWAGRVVTGRQEGRTDTLAQLQWFGQRAFASATHTSIMPPRSTGLDSTQSTVVDAATFIGFADGQLGWGREGIDGFSLVKVHPSLDKARTRVEHYGQRVFRDDGLGPVALPFQRGYSPVRQDLLAERLPEGYALAETQQQIFPGFRTGYKFTIGSDAYLSVQGVLLAKGGAPLPLRIGKFKPARAELPTVDFFTAEDGTFFAQGLAAGTYQILIDSKPIGSLAVKPGTDLLVQTGEVTTDAE